MLKTNPLKKQTFLGQMLDKREKYNLELNDIVAVMCDLIIGGVDTTSTSIHYLLYELGMNPTVQEKLYKELKKNLSTDQVITEEDLTKLRFLKYVIKESLRLI